MVHTTGGSKKTDGGKRPRARSGGGRGQGQSLWIDLCVPTLPLPRPRAAVLLPLLLPPLLSPLDATPHPHLVPLGAGVGRRVRRVHRAQVSGLGGLLGDMLEAGWWRAGVNSQGDGYTGLGI